MQVTMLQEKIPCEELQASNCVKTRHHTIILQWGKLQTSFVSRLNYIQPVINMKLVILVLQCYQSVNVLNRVMSFKTMGNMIGQVSVACPTKRSQPPLQSSSITVFLNCDQAVLLPLLGSFSINDGYGSANVTCKMNLPFFKLCRVSSNSLTMSNEGEFPLS